MATALPYFATPARTCVQRASSPRARSGGVRRSAMTTAPSCLQNLMAAPFCCNTAVSPRKRPIRNDGQGHLVPAGRRNEPLATDLIGIHSRYHDLADTCMAAFLVASWPSAGLRSYFD